MEKVGISRFWDRATDCLALIIRLFVRAEKGLYLLTGIKGRLLALYWRETGKRLQHRLNVQHGTNIKYGYIK